MNSHLSTATNGTQRIRIAPVSIPVISVVIPVYQTDGLIDELVGRLQASLNTITRSYEIILVDDASTDSSWEYVVAQAGREECIRGLRLQHNHGQHLAIRAGLAISRGAWVVVMDGDLQEWPEDIPALWALAQDGGYAQVLARRQQRPDGWVARAGSWLFYQLLRIVVGVRHDPGVANFGLYRRAVITAVEGQQHSQPFFPIQALLAGGTTAVVDVAHNSRPVGRSSYSLWRRVQLAWQVLRSFTWPASHGPAPVYFVAESTDNLSSTYD